MTIDYVLQFYIHNWKNGKAIFGLKVAIILSSLLVFFVNNSVIITIYLLFVKNVLLGKPSYYPAFHLWQL